MFLDQRRSVGGPRLSRNVFWTKVGQLGPRVCHVTFLDQRRSVGAPRLSRNQPGTMRNQPFWLVSIVPWFMVGFHSFLRWFHGFLWFLVDFHGFSRWFHGFSWFLVGFHGFSMWFHGFCLVSMIFKVVSWFLMVFGWFPWFLKVSRWIFIVINNPRLVKSELSAAGAK